MITALQRAVAELFFSLPESAGFAVAGGAALIARDLVDRGTRDVDLFTVSRPWHRSPTRRRRLSGPRPARAG